MSRRGCSTITIQRAVSVHNSQVEVLIPNLTSLVRRQPIMRSSLL